MSILRFSTASRCVPILVFLCAVHVCLAQWDPAWDDRHGIVATRTSGYTHPEQPYQGPVYFDRLSMKWWYDYVQDSSPAFAGYPKLYMYWRATLGRSAAAIQQDAAAARLAHPSDTIWWAMSNEPNDRGQANQSPEDFAAIYLHHHRNLRLGDPDCKILGPGLLNWTFESTSVWESGKDWYERFRAAWYALPEARAYSESEYGVSYPPQDGFNFHAYDLRGVQGTPWEPLDWRWCRDQIVACRTDLLTYPEVLDQTIWLTEFGALREADMGTNISHCVGLVSWMRQQEYMKRWFWFIIHSDMYGNWPPLELLDAEAQPTALGLVAGELARLPRADEVLGFPAHETFARWEQYVRPGWSNTGTIAWSRTDKLQIALVSGQSYSAGQMRGFSFDVPGRVHHLHFDYSANYDGGRVAFAVDAGDRLDAWRADVVEAPQGHVALALPDRPSRIALALLIEQPFQYPHPSGEWQVTVRDLVLLYTPFDPAHLEVE